jgi:hypothetical protein
VKPGPTTVAFYLPQYQPIPENDAWYGQGFTEWHNVVQARPLFDGHYQPHIPQDFGFYDLRVPETREAQARAALAHGIDAFCYYHYWFHGHRPLRRVVDDVLEHGSPHIPFCLAWANENWSRHWDATSHEALLTQRYSPEDDEEHGLFLLRAMTHRLYLRIQGRPVFFIYRIQAMPDSVRTLARWRRLWRAGGLEEVLVVKFDTHGNVDDPASFGADAAAQFLPHGIEGMVPAPPGNTGNSVWRYEDVANAYLSAAAPAWPRHECVLPGWDNTPRRGDGRSMVIHGSTPQRYEQWLSRVHARTPADRIVLINAWNEWAEGAHLEPDLKYGRAYLEATARAVGLDVRPPPAEAAAQQPLVVRDRFADLYLDVLESQTRLQRRLSRFEATFERQLAEATAQARAEADSMRAHALILAQENGRLRSEIERLEGGRPTVSAADNELEPGLRQVATEDVATRAAGAAIWPRGV